MAVSLKSYALISLSDLKTRLNVSESSADDLYNTLINVVSDRIRVYCNRDFIETEQTEIRSGNGKDKFYLKHWPISSTPTMYVDDSNTQDWEAATTYNLIVQSDTESLNQGWIYLKYAHLFPKGRRNLKFVYTAGYTLADVPQDLKEAVALIIGHIKHQTDNNLWGLQSISHLSETSSYNLEDWPKRAIDILNSYRRPIV